MSTTTQQSVNLLSSVWTHLTTLQPTHGEGVHLYDEQGNKYLDFTSGIGVTSTGHCHPRVVQAIQEQATRLLFGQINCIVNPRAVELAAKLTEVMPAGIDRFFFANSGTEATEACVKLARFATGRKDIIVFQGGFHGRSHLCMAMTSSRPMVRAGYQPLPSGIVMAPWPNAYHYGWSEEETVDFCVKELEHLLHTQTAPEETAAMIIEPVMGEGGYVPAPPAFLREMRRICDQYGILLIMDEVQTGFGRTGKFFCFEHAGIIPDIIVMAKGLGSGLPISGIAASEALMAKWTPGSHGGTYGGGSAIACAAACATLDVIREEGLVENAEQRGKQLMAGLRRLQGAHPAMGDVRGIGLMAAVEFTKPDGSPDPDTMSKVQKACLADRLLLLGCGSYKNVIRWIPPLVVSEEEIDEALEIFARALRG
ncbi:MAG TPA: aspartate aminotransferase family protein [Flavilitoribacter sp.]|nr:aspartate aminotransferase family protein [Flavilitoribacter sp.]HMQ86800.1 aspartate aminotransferase family protein [Flavilitoribacter sp.]